MPRGLYGEYTDPNTGEYNPNLGPYTPNLQPGDWGYQPPSGQIGLPPGATFWGAGGGIPPADPNLMRPYSSVAEATQAWQEGLLRGSNLPLSFYLSNVNPAPGQGGSSRLTGALLPPGSSSANQQTTTGQTSGTSTMDTSGTTSGAWDQETIRRLPPDVRDRLMGLIDQLTGRTDFGYTPEEIEAMRIGGAEGRGLISRAQRPIAGAADAARQQMLMRSAARGGYLPGLSRTVEEIQREQGRQAGQVAQEALLGISAANRAAALAAANARLTESGDVRRQIGGLLTAFPEGSTTSSGTSSGASSSSSSGTTTGQSSTTTEGTSSTGPAQTGPLVPGGLNTSTGQAPIGGGGTSGARPKTTTSRPPSTPRKPGFASLLP